MKDETTAAIDSTQLIKRLERLEVTVDIVTLQKWSKQGLIPEYETGHQHKQMKKGRPKNTKKSKKGRTKKADNRILQKGLPGLRSKWLPETIEEAAAVWAVRNSGITKPEMILKIKDQANDVYHKAYVVCEIPPITRCFGGLQPRQHPLLFKTRFVSAYGPKEDNTKMNETISLFPGKTREERADALNKLVKIWIAAVEKVRYTERARKAGRDDDVWPITRIARVRLYLKASGSVERRPDGTVIMLGSRYDRDRSQLEKLENASFFDDGSNDGVDDIVLYENDVDVRLVILLTLAKQALDDFGPLPEGFADFSSVSAV
jgi:hypothetical protein